MTKEEPKIALHLALYRNDETNRWIARGLDFDFIGEGETDMEAIESFIVAVKAELIFAEEDGRKPLEGLPRTPDWFVEWWRAEKLRRNVREQTVGEYDGHVPPPWMILEMEKASLTL